MWSLPFVVLQLALAQPTPPPSSEPATIRPPLLEEGDTVALVAPASPLDRALVLRAVEYLSERGYTVKVQLEREEDGYLSESDENRALELNAMFADPEVRAIVCLRGGYGSPRILDRIDYDLVRTHPKIIVGYSDITALLNAVHTRTGLVVFHGPMGKDMAVSGGLPRVAADHLFDAVRGKADRFDTWGTGPERAAQLETIAEGEAEGFLSGGNLSVLTATIGTPYEVRTDGAILFLEEVQEEPFRIDRMLNQLRLAGKLRHVRGVLLCEFARCEGTGANTRPLATLFREYFGDLGVPVLAGFPAGHVSENVTLPIGARVRLDATRKKLSIVEPPVAPRTAR